MSNGGGFQSREPSVSLVSSNSSEIRCKCDFCEVTFKSDLDASRHLSSASHVNNRDSFMSLQNLHDKGVEKQIPKNLLQVLKLLRLRTVRDLRELTDKGFFEIHNEPLVGVADKLARVLSRSLVRSKWGILSQEEKAVILNSEVAKKYVETGYNATRQTEPEPSTSIPQPQPTPAPTEGINQPPVKAEPTDPNQPIPYNPNPVRAAQSQIPQPQASTSAPFWTPTPVSNHRLQPTSRVQTINLPSVGSIPESSRNTQESSSSFRAPQPQPRLQFNAPRFNHPDSRNQSLPEPSNSEIQRDPNGSSADEERPRQPVPRLDSTYVPRLATIKSEPKD